MKRKYKIKRSNINEQLYCFALAIFIFRYIILFYSEIGKGIPIVQNLCYTLVIALIILKIFINRRITGLPTFKKVLFWGSLITGCAIGISLFELNFVATVLLILFAYDVDYKKILKVATTEIILCVIVVIMLCKMGLIQDVVRFKGETPRHGLGFTYIGALGTFYLQVVLSIFYIEQKRIKWSKILILYAIEILVFSQDRFVGNFALTSFLFIAFIIFIKWDKKLLKPYKLWKKISLLLYPATAIISFILVELYKTRLTPWLLGLNRILNGRLSVPASVSIRQGYHLFANGFETVGLVALDSGESMDMYNYIDNGFLNILFRYGIIITLLVIVMYTMFFSYSVRTGNKMCVIWLIVILVQSIVYAYLLNIPSNLLVILCFSSLFHKSTRYRMEGDREIKHLLT